MAKPFAPDHARLDRVVAEARQQRELRDLDEAARTRAAEKPAVATHHPFADLQNLLNKK